MVEGGSCRPAGVELPPGASPGPEEGSTAPPGGEKSVQAETRVGEESSPEQKGKPALLG